MAGQRQQKVVSEVGHFYYDWALSRYRWTDDRFPNKADGLPFKEVLPALCEVKVGNKYGVRIEQGEYIF